MAAEPSDLLERVKSAVKDEKRGMMLTHPLFLP
jgi:hypothetical protein